MNHMDTDAHKAAAHHEAGHVIVGICLGFSLASVHLAPPTGGGADWQGCTKFDPPLPDVDCQIIMIEAGPMAGYIFDPDSKAAACDGKDRQMIEERRSCAKQSRDALRAQAAQRVGKNWDLIKRVAQALFEAETRELSGDQVHALLPGSFAADCKRIDEHGG